ncbi:hypothetical protein BaRGS_00012741 [Batillaria attramentaria]|uniref:Uncharacterized protein n=1 Tax=Batillaria attramentaria TaxID=370345 RepID=A0ABD0L9L9_9CAEN
MRATIRATQAERDHVTHTRLLDQASQYVSGDFFWTHGFVRRRSSKNIYADKSHAPLLNSEPAGHQDHPLNTVFTYSPSESTKDKGKIGGSSFKHPQSILSIKSDRRDRNTGITTVSGGIVSSENVDVSDVMGLTSKDKVERKVVNAFQEAKRRRRMKEEFSHFCTETSFTAITRIYNASSIRRRIGWTVLLLGMLAWLSIQCFWLLNLYFQYPMEVKMDIEAARQLEFPSVTVCNMNPIKKQEVEHNPAFYPLKHFTDKIDDDDMLYDYYNTHWDHFHPTDGTDSVWTTKPGAPARKKRASPHKQNTMDNTETVPNVQSKPYSVVRQPPDLEDEEDQQEAWRILESELFHVHDHHGNRDKRSISAERRDKLVNNSFNKWDALDNENINISYYMTRGTEYKAAMAYATLTAKLEPETVKQSGHSLEDLILNCRFNGWQCSPKNFTYFHSHKYGNCYTFNSHEVPERLYTKFAGPEFGLQLEMYIQQSDYVPALAAEAGVRVVIHPRGIVPFPEDNGVSIPPAHASSIVIREVPLNLQ